MVSKYRHQVWAFPIARLGVSREWEVSHFRRPEKCESDKQHWSIWRIGKEMVRSQLKTKYRELCLAGGQVAETQQVHLHKNNSLRNRAEDTEKMNGGEVNRLSEVSERTCQESSLDSFCLLLFK